MTSSEMMRIGILLREINSAIFNVAKELQFLPLPAQNRDKAVRVHQSLTMIEDIAKALKELMPIPKEN